MDPDSENAVRYNVSTDGSKMSRQCYDQVLDSLMHPADHLVVTHVFDLTKTFLPKNLQHGYIESIMEAELSGRLDENKYNMCFEERDHSITTKEQITNIAKAYSVDVLCIGMHGRKKEDAEYTICGSNVDLIAQDPVCPVMVVKTLEVRKDKEGEAFRWGVCLDGSNNSLTALRKIFKFMNVDKDWVDVIHVRKMSIKAETVQMEADKIIADAGISNHTFHVIEWQEELSREQSILNHVHQSTTPYIDFFVVANHGTGFSKHKDEKYLGRVAKGLLTHSKTNVMLIV